MIEEVIPNGTIVTALRNIASGNVWAPLIYAHDELRVMGYTLEGGAVGSYRVVTHNGVHVYVNPEDIQVETSNYPANIKAAIQKAFQDGYARGHSRGLCCGRLYKEDTDYRGEKHRETIAYLQEIDDESNH